MKTRLVLSFFAFLIGLGVIGTSLMNTSTGIAAGQTSISSKQMYLGEVLPDHVAYLVITIMDKFYLETATPTERIHYEIKYSHRRLEYAKALLEKGEDKQDLALATITKSQKYLIKAFSEAEQIVDLSDSTKDLLQRALIFNIREVKELTLKFPDYDRTVMDELRQQEQMMLDKLQS